MGKASGSCLCGPLSHSQNDLFRRETHISKREREALIGNEYSREKEASSHFFDCLLFAKK